MKRVYLIGFMGSGKTTVAKHLSQKLQIEYIDMDKVIEKIKNKKISDIFKEEGEDAFRAYENKTLTSIVDIPIISTGGGIVEQDKNIQWMKEKGIIIYLQTSFHIIMDRLQKDNTRPLWRGNQQNKALYVKRVKMYENCADYLINCDNKTLDEVVNELIELFRYKGILEGEK